MDDHRRMGQFGADPRMDRDYGRPVPPRGYTYSPGEIPGAPMNGLNVGGFQQLWESDIPTNPNYPRYPSGQQSVYGGPQLVHPPQQGPRGDNFHVQYIPSTQYQHEQQAPMMYPRYPGRPGERMIDESSAAPPMFMQSGSVYPAAPQFAGQPMSRAAGGAQAYHLSSRAPALAVPNVMGGGHQMAPGPAAGSGGAGRQGAAGGSNAQGRAINKMLLDILRDRVIDPQRLHLAIETFVDRMDCVNLATLLFHTGKKRFLLAPVHVKMVSDRLNFLREELRAREASNALYGLKCLSSEIPEVRELVHALANKITVSSSDFVAQAVGNALYGLQMMSSEYEEVRFLLLVLSAKVAQCTELLEAQNVGNALYGLRGMNSDHKEVRAVVAAITPKVAMAKEELNGQALGNSLYGLQSMSSKESEVRCLLTVLAAKVSRTWEELKAQEVGNALYGLKRMSSDVAEVRGLVAALVPKIASSPDLLDAQAIGNSFYGLQNMKSDSAEILALMAVLAEKVAISNPELDGQAMGNSLYGLQGMSSDFGEVRAAISALTAKIQTSMLEMNAQELGNAMYGLQNMVSGYKEVRRLLLALAQKLSLSKHELTSQEIGNALFGLQGMSSEHSETRILLTQLSAKIVHSHSVLDPQGVSNSLFGLQRLSSESQEVRSLLLALAVKVEHCWKALSAHHVSHACFGLQCLSSEHAETRVLLKALLPKVVSCREELSAKQLSVAFFGLQSMNSAHPEVRALLVALAEKASLSADVWSAQHLALAVFGLQGMSSELDETALALGVLAYKASFAPVAELDAVMLANLVFGLQRMSSSCAEVVKLLAALLPALHSLRAQPERLTPLLCANMLFGVQGCSVALEAVQLVFELALGHLSAATELLSKRSPRKAKAHELFHEYLALGATLAMVQSVAPDLSAGDELHLRCVRVLGEAEAVVRELAEFHAPRWLSAAEQNLAREVTELLRGRGCSDALLVQAPALVCGFFELAVCLIAPPSPLHSSSSQSSSSPSQTLNQGEPRLALELVGSSYCYPAKELFCHLQLQYLERAQGLRVFALSAQAFANGSQQGLPLHPDAQTAVQTLADDCGFFAGITKTATDFAFVPPPSTSSNTSSVQSLNNNNNMQGGFTGSEYYDDELRFGGEAEPRRRGGSYSRRALGMPLGWAGDWPVLGQLQHGLASQQFLRFAAAAAAQMPQTTQTLGLLGDSRARLILERGMMPIHTLPLEQLHKLNFSSDSTVLLDRELDPDPQTHLPQTQTQASQLPQTSQSLFESGQGLLSGTLSESQSFRQPRGLFAFAHSGSGSFLLPHTHSADFPDPGLTKVSQVAPISPPQMPQLTPSSPSRDPIGHGHTHGHMSQHAPHTHGHAGVYGASSAVFELARSDSEDTWSKEGGAGAITHVLSAASDDAQLLEAQLEMRRLEARIQTLRGRKQHLRGGAPSEGLGSSSIDALQGPPGLF